MKAARFVHTVRHLKPVQVRARLLRKVRRPRVTPAPAPARREAVAAPAAPIPRMRRLYPDRAVFLEETGTLRGAEAWNDPARPKLWLYNLHYFEDLVGPAQDADHAALREALVRRWIAENPLCTGNGWEPYPLSLRIVAFVKWILAGGAADGVVLDSLATQARRLSQDVEWHILGNHLFANAKALAFAGLFFAGEEAEAWLATGTAILTDELAEQILADGGHFERSPMYHAIILEDVLDLLALARAFGVADRPPFAGLPAIAQRMRAALAAMTHPDGGIAFFNDAAFGVAATTAEIEAYAARLGLAPLAPVRDGVHHLEQSGYVRIDCGDMAAILDVALVGPDYIPGHAHADTLSFELSLGAERIVVNSGTSIYAPGRLREAQRATAAHSTVEVAGENSSEVWASFRVARRARPFDVTVREDGDAIVVAAAHDGYRRLPGAPVHERRWTFSGTRLEVADTVRAAGAAPAATARFHLAPGVGPEPPEGGGMALRTSSGRRIALATATPSAVDPSHWYPRFGVVRENLTVSAPLAGSPPALTTTFAWDAP